MCYWFLCLSRVFVESYVCAKSTVILRVYAVTRSVIYQGSWSGRKNVFKLFVENVDKADFFLPTWNNSITEISKMVRHHQRTNWDVMPHP